MTEKIYASNAYEIAVRANVVRSDRDDNRVMLDRTVFYPGGGGQPHDLGTLTVGEDRVDVTRVTEDRDGVWHWVEGSLPSEGETVDGLIDWGRRYELMRTHTAMHALCGVIWNRFKSPVTGGDMKPGEGRLDFDLPDWNSDELPVVEEDVNRELNRGRDVEISFLPRDAADKDPSLIRTKVNLLPSGISEVRVVDIVGLDRQADGGTHVSDTGQVGYVSIVKAENKGRGFRRLRLRLGET